MEIDDCDDKDWDECDNVDFDNYGDDNFDGDGDGDDLPNSNPRIPCRFRSDVDVTYCRQARLATSKAIKNEQTHHYNILISPRTQNKSMLVYQ